ncbi:hypothetical protein SAMN05216604_13541 [Pseudomonas agarici]|nr:hypothetical protein SAMN05216604_13541 [Pseudomonas agarici]
MLVNAVTDGGVMARRFWQLFMVSIKQGKNSLRQKDENKG